MSDNSSDRSTIHSITERSSRETKLMWSGLDHLNYTVDDSVDEPIPEIDLRIFQKIFKPTTLSNGKPIERTKVLDSVKIWEQHVRSIHHLSAFKHTIKTSSKQLDSAVVDLYNKLFYYYSVLVPSMRLKPDIPWKEIFLGTLTGGWEYNSELKKVRAARQRDVMVSDLPNDLSNFPSSHLIFWACEELPDDYKYAFAAPLPTDPKLLDKVKEKMRKYIRKNVATRELDIIDAIYLINDKKTFYKREKTTNRRVRDMDISLTSNFEYLLSSATTAPDEVRLVSIADIPTRNTMYITRENITKILKHPSDAFYSDPQSHYKSLSREGKYLLVDIKKFGWSVSFQPLLCVLDVILEFYPLQQFEILRAGIKNTYLEIDGSRKKVQNGAMLGMLDYLFSFFSCCLLDVFNEDFNLSLEGRFHGDDSYIFVDRNCNLPPSVCFNTWCNYLRLSGIRINSKKSIVACRGLFCEIYGSDGNQSHKVIDQLLNVIGCASLPHYMAKEKVASLYQFWCKRNVSGNKELDDMFKVAVSSLIRCIGFEFDINEINLPLLMGGWFHRKKCGLDTSYEMFCEGHIPPKYRNLIKFNRRYTISKDKRLKKLWKPVIEKMPDNLRLLIDSKINKRYTLNIEKSDIEYNVKQRQELFHSKRGISMLEFERIILGKKQFLPSNLFIDLVDQSSSFSVARPRSAVSRSDPKYEDMYGIPTSIKVIDSVRAKYLLDVYTSKKTNIMLVTYHKSLGLRDILYSATKALDSKWLYTVNMWRLCDQYQYSFHQLYKLYTYHSLSLYRHIPRMLLKELSIPFVSLPKNRPVEQSDFIFWSHSKFPVIVSCDTFLKRYHEDFSYDIESSFEFVFRNAESIFGWCGALGIEVPNSRSLIKTNKEDGVVIGIDVNGNPIYLRRPPKEAEEIPSHIIYDAVEETIPLVIPRLSRFSWEPYTERYDTDFVLMDWIASLVPLPDTFEDIDDDGAPESDEYQYLPGESETDRWFRENNMLDYDEDDLGDNPYNTTLDYENIVVGHISSSESDGEMSDSEIQRIMSGGSKVPKKASENNSSKTDYDSEEYG